MSILGRLFQLGAFMAKPTHYEEEPYELWVSQTVSWMDSVSVRNRFGGQVAYAWLSESGVDSLWILQVCYIWGNISVRLFGDTYQEQMKFKRREDVIRFIEKRLGVTRNIGSPPRPAPPPPNMTVWEAEDAAQPR